jgi:ubiquinone/menaquinone biosynthesis C-methylase UbiE
MDDWAEIWELKGLLKTTDFKKLDGYEGTDIDFAEVVRNIRTSLKIKPGDKILEVGCGAGALAVHFKDCDYTGVDKSQTMVNKFRELVGRDVVCTEPDYLFFPNERFDHVIMYSVAQYFPDHKYYMKVEGELCRVSKRGVFIGDLPEKSHRDSHLLFNKDWFKNWTITGGYYNKDRFNVYRSF